MRITIEHRIALPPAKSPGHPVQQLLLTPVSGPTQSVSDWTIEIEGIERAAVFTDAFCNRAHLVNQPAHEGELVLRAHGAVETLDRAGVLGFAPDGPVLALFTRITPLTEVEPDFVAEFAEAAASGQGRIALLHALMAKVHAAALGAKEPEPAEGADPAVVSGMSQSIGGTTQSMADMSQSLQTLGGAEESSHDETAAVDASTLAHRFIGGARALGIPARFVSGYLCDDGAGRWHAWAEAFDESIGWIGFDPALDLCPTERHVRVATALDAMGARPIRVARSGGEPREELVSVTVSS